MNLYGKESYRIFNDVTHVIQIIKTLVRLTGKPAGIYYITLYFKDHKYTVLLIAISLIFTLNYRRFCVWAGS